MSDKHRINRRSFLKVVGAGTAVATGLRGAPAAEARAPEEEPYGILVDTTRCIGCRSCELACTEAHGDPDPDFETEDIFATLRQPTTDQNCVVNRFETDKGEIYVKRQCMHCVQPACASACLTKAMLKTDEGPVVWRENKCMGCRFCMLSCPFNIPKFEYDSAVPRIRKCDMCVERTAKGELPACVAECMGEALMYGRRDELLREAHRRIAENPDDYVPWIYGEQEAGGTSWLYLAAVPFDQLGFNTELAKEPYPEFTKEFLYGVPVVLTVVPAFLAALSNATRREDEETAEEADDER
jgi:Fe-S-cluster-containing dehydrogenase component